MGEMSTFESRTGIVNCTAEELYHFLTDIRNFERFIPKDKFSDVMMDKESCSFNLGMMGKVNIRIREKKEFSEVIYAGNAMQVNDISLIVEFFDADSSHSRIKLRVLAGLNPILKMFATEPVKKFLETIIKEMEKFNGWKEISGDNRTP
jgi:carbon monoxide dehydrogenase subunit G